MLRRRIRERICSARPAFDLESQGHTPGRDPKDQQYMISAVAELYKLHPQTLRLYERVGLLKPSRSQGNTRLYTDSDLERLDVILTLARDLGVNLAGIEIILNMREKMIEMEHQMGEFARVVQQELSRVASRTDERPSRHAIVRAAPRVVRSA
jgi:MerR family transcriptional regulator/heat shock protein HspR